MEAASRAGSEGRGQSAPRPASPAERYDPPLRRQAWRTARSADLADFLAEARERWEAGPAAFERVLWHGGLHLDGRPLDLEAGRPPPARVEAGCRVVAWGFLREPEEVPFGPERILLDAHGVVAVDKPAWLPVQRTRASRRHGLEARLRELTGCPSLVAVHRLDRETSGVALFARGPEAARRLGRALAGRRVEKRYRVVTRGAPRAERFAMSGDLVRVPHASRFRFALSRAPLRGGRFSHTDFRLLVRAGGRAWLEAVPRTGRTHQIRVHLAAHGTPVAGDPLYGPPGAPRDAERLQLHAASLGLPLVEGAAPTRIHAPLPPDLCGDVP